jgi:hypothetical protein
VRKKHNKRLSDTELARRIAEADLIEPAILDALLERDPEPGKLAEAIVEAGLLPDWELGRWASRWFDRPFLPLDLCVPDPEAAKGLSASTLIRTGNVPLWRYAEVLVIAMPGITSEDALVDLANEAECTITAVVGSIRGNRRWLTENLPKAALPSGTTSPDAATQDQQPWSLLLDACDIQAREGERTVSETNQSVSPELRADGAERRRN